MSAIVFAQEGISSGVVTALISGAVVLVSAAIAYFVGRHQQRANVAHTETQTRIAKDAAEVTNAKLAVETRLVDIEANQAGLAYYQNLVTDMAARIKEKDAERAIEQVALRAQVDEIKSAQAEAKSLHNDRIEELLKNIDGLIVSLGDADAKIVVLQGQIDELQLKVEGSNEIIAEMQNEMKKDKEVIAALRLEIQGLLVQTAEKAEAANVALTKDLE